MLKKVCPYCGKSSYSASDRGKWICPSCDEDITHVSTALPEHIEIDPRDEFIRKSVVSIKRMIERREKK